MIFDIITAQGHPNIRATHSSTLEITTEEQLTLRGDCIIAVKADKATNSINPRLLELLKKEYHLAIAIIVDEEPDLIDVFFAKGHRGLKFNDTKSIVIRKSSYIDPRTLAVRSTKAAKDIDRDVVKKLREGESPVKIVLTPGPTRLKALHDLSRVLAEIFR